MRMRTCALLAAVMGTSAMSLNASADVLWNNGPLATGTVTRSNGSGGPGVAAPAGSQWSELYQGNTSAGVSTHPTGTTGAFRVADNFTLTAPSDLSTVTAFAYMTGSANTALFTVGNIRIWDGRPGDAGSNVIFGDTTTDRLVDSQLTNIYRVFSTDNNLIGGIGSAPGTTRHIKTAVYDVSGLSLPAGTYWVDYQMTSAVSATGAVFHPNVTLLDARGPVGANGRQFITTPAWQDMLDAGDPAALPDIAQELAFMVEGTVVPEPTMGLAVLALGGLAARRRR
jgi:MYXO-CTERM domain-containing protein